MILIMRTALRAFVPTNRVGRFRIMVSTGAALNSEIRTGAGSRGASGGPPLSAISGPRSRN